MLLLKLGLQTTNFRQ